MKLVRVMSLTLATSAAAMLSIPAVATAADKAAPAGPNDAQIAHIVVTANTIDVEAGELAMKTSARPEVKHFAEMMVKDHKSVNKSAVDLATKLGVKPEDNDTSRALMKGHGENMAKLRALKGAEFDRAYIDHEVAYHVAVLDAIDKVLVPNAKNAELKALIVKVRPAIATHLDHARKAQASLK